MKREEKHFDTAFCRNALVQEQGLTSVLHIARVLCGGPYPDDGLQSLQDVWGPQPAEMRGGLLHSGPSGQLPHQAPAESAPALPAPQQHLPVLCLPLEVRNMCSAPLRPPGEWTSCRLLLPKLWVGVDWGTAVGGVHCWTDH